MTKSLEPRTKVVLLHGGDINPEVIAGPARLELEGPYDLDSFTDTFPDKNPLNEALESMSWDANIVVVEERLMKAPSACARAVVNAAAFSPNLESFLTLNSSDSSLIPSPHPILVLADFGPRASSCHESLTPMSLAAYLAYRQSDKRALGTAYRRRFESFGADAPYMAEVAFRREQAGIAVLDVMAEEFAANVTLGIYPDLNLTRTEARTRYLDGVRELRMHTDIRARGGIPGKAAA